MLSEIDHVLQQIYLGKQHIVAHDGVSQYRPSGTGGGTSACGLAALNCARIVFDKENQGITGNDLLRELLTREVAEDIISICSHWTSSEHLDIEDIIQIPLFRTSLSSIQTPSYYHDTNLKSFKKLLQDMKDATPSSVAVMITRPPEIIACLKVQRPLGEDVFVIFDSHTRPIHPQGAGLIFNTSMDEAAKYLTGLLEVDKRLFSNDRETSFKWQVDLMRHFSAHMLVSKCTINNLASLTQSVIEASLTILSLKAEISTLKQDKLSLATENNNLKKLQNKVIVNDHCSFRGGPSSSALETPDSRHRLPRPATNAYRSGQRKFVPTLKTTAKLPDVVRDSNQTEDGDLIFALQLQHNFANDEKSIQQAIAEQAKYEEEDKRLIAERTALTAAFPSLFECSICLDEHPEDFSAQIPQCRHKFCRNCIRQHIRSKLRDHLFPILCPICIAEKGSLDPGVIGDSLVQQIGVGEDEYSIFEELQISAFSVLLHCRKCQQTMFVDRAEYQGMKILACPLPGCQHVWCKHCQQSVDMTGPQHSCDGSSELQHLMRRSGWRYCPGCSTPIQKESGCNHMTVRFNFVRLDFNRFIIYSACHQGVIPTFAINVAIASLSHHWEEK